MFNEKEALLSGDIITLMRNKAIIHISLVNPYNKVTGCMFVC